MKPVAVVSHPPFSALGGGEAVAAWTVQALAHDYEVVLVCRESVDFDEIDVRFGTSLRLMPPRVVTWPGWMRCFLRVWPGVGDRWQHCFQEQRLMSVARRTRVDVWISTFNESRLPAPGVQYVHFPSHNAAAGWAGRVYEWCAQALSCRGMAGLEAHRTLVNSRFTAEAWCRLGRVEAEIVYPPVPPLGEGRPWDERAEHRMIYLGRLLPFKGIERIARIVEKVREEGVPMTLTLVGAWCCSRKDRRKLERALSGYDWIEWCGVLPRRRLIELVTQSRYGLHGMEGEPFGIAVAEMQAAGCVVFAPSRGGPAEILAEPGQLYENETDAVEKILSVVRSPERQMELHTRAAGRAGLFSSEQFMAEMLVAARRAEIRGI